METTRRCACCKKKFEATRERQLYCGEQCKNRAAQVRFRARYRSLVEGKKTQMSKPKAVAIGISSPKPVIAKQLINPTKGQGREPENPLADILDNLFDKQGVVEIPEDDEPVDPWK